MQKEYCNLLIISHNPFSKIYNNGKTLSSIFGSWPHDKIAQLYFSDESPDTSVCSSFFRITDADLLSIGAAKQGRKIFTSSFQEDNCGMRSRVLSSLRRYRTLPFLNFCRNMLWTSGRWRTSKLKEWLDEVNPEVVFLMGGGVYFPYRIARRISIEYSAPLFFYFTDDYLGTIKTLDPFWWINWFWLRIEVRRALPDVHKLFVIGQEMAVEYGQKLQKECVQIMNSVEIKEFQRALKSDETPMNSTNKITFAYFGGLHANRWRTLAAFARALKSANEESSIEARFNIYSSKNPDVKILEKVVLKPYVSFLGRVSESQIVREMLKHDVLIHAESFDSKTRQKTRLSISTKIPEYLATGKPIFAIGPGEISSIRYLRQNEAGIVVDTANEEKLKMAIIEVFKNYDKYTESGKKNRILAEQNHDLNRVRELIRQELTDNT